MLLSPFVDDNEGRGTPSEDAIVVQDQTQSPVGCGIPGAKSDEYSVTDRRSGRI